MNTLQKFEAKQLAKLQEAKQRKIKVSRQQIGAAIENVEKRNKLPTGGLRSKLRQNKMPVDNSIVG